MKKNAKKITVIALAIFVAIGCYLVSSTYAKYTSTISGNGSANVAKWSWTINSQDINSYAAAQNGFTINLFETVNDSDGTSTESDVASGKLAPGMTGSFQIALTNNSEVNATYAVNLSESQSNVPNGITRIPIEYSTDGGSTWSQTISGANVSTTNINMGNSVTTTVQWRWTYTESERDTIDTQLGFAANTEGSEPSVSVTANVVVTQRD